MPGRKPAPLPHRRASCDRRLAGGLQRRASSRPARQAAAGAVRGGNHLATATGRGSALTARLRASPRCTPARPQTPPRKSPKEKMPVISPEKDSSNHSPVAFAVEIRRPQRGFPRRSAESASPTRLVGGGGVRQTGSRRHSLPSRTCGI